MHTIITYPADSDFCDKVESIRAYTVGSKILEDTTTVTGSHITLGMSRDGLYLVYVHGCGYHRLSVFKDEIDARRVLQLLKEVHGIRS